MPNAIDTFSRAVILFPQEAAPLSARADAWGQLGDFAKALDDINRAIALEPESAFWYAHRARILRALKRDDEAAADFEKAEELAKRMVGGPTDGK